MRQVAGILGVATLVAAIAGCSSPPPAAPPSFAPPTTLTAQNLQPPAQIGALPQVIYDPCTWIPDSVVSKAGYNPASRQRYMDQTTDPVSIILGCRFLDDADGRFKQKFDLHIDSANIGLAEGRRQAEATGHQLQITPININGRAGFELRDAYYGTSCFTFLATRIGYVRLHRITLPSGPIDVCEKILDLTELIEPTIGSDN